ncbi:MAG: outer membrane beta-barrel protein [Nitrospira sp.]
MKDDRLMRLTMLLLVCVTAVLWQGLAQAETYIGGMLGVAVPLPGTVTGDENLNYPNPPGPGQLFRGASTRIGMAASVAYGGKLGHYFGAWPWLGLEAELLTATPHVMAGTIAIDTKSQTVGTFREAQSGVHLRMTTGAVSVLVRYPGLHWQPYAGVGPAVFWGHASGTGLSCDHRCQGPEVETSSVTLGWTSQLGLRYLVTPQVGVFGEWKYQSTTAHFDQVRSLSHLDVSYQTHLVVVGVSYHFH